MTAHIVDGKSLQESIFVKVASQVEKMFAPPRLVVVTVGDDPASKVYVRNKKRACEACGIEFAHKAFAPHEVSTSTLCQHIRAIANSNAFDGIIVQLPLPKHIDAEQIKTAIPPRLDVDGFHPLSHFSPCTPRGIIATIESVNYDIAGKHAVVIGRSDIVGRPLARMLLDEDATVTVCHSKTIGLETITRTADILISAVGKPHFIEPIMVKEGAFVIDVGINRDENGKVCGDVRSDVADVAGWLTPVPNGVGRMTVACLMQNVMYSRIVNSKE